MPRDSLDLIDQHILLLNRREQSKKRTRLRNKIPDDWKSDKVFPADKPATYTPTSPGRDVASGGYLRSEYQIQVHNRNYARFVVSQRSNAAKVKYNEGESKAEEAKLVRRKEEKHDRKNSEPNVETKDVEQELSGMEESEI